MGGFGGVGMKEADSRVSPNAEPKILAYFVCHMVKARPTQRILIRALFPLGQKVEWKW